MFGNKLADFRSTTFRLYGHWLIDFRQLLQDSTDLLIIPEAKTTSSHSHNNN